MVRFVLDNSLLLLIGTAAAVVTTPPTRTSRPSLASAKSSGTESVLPLCESAAEAATVTRTLTREE